MEERLSEYFEDYASLCQFKILGTYEVFVIDTKVYANDTRDLFLKFKDICNKTDEKKLNDFLEEYGY